MAVTTDLTEDVKTLQFRLALEGCNWEERPNNFLTLDASVEPFIWLHHPQLGTTWFRGWATLGRHCDEGWKQTYFPHL